MKKQSQNIELAIISRVMVCATRRINLPRVRPPSGQPPLRGASVGSTSLARGLRRIDLPCAGPPSDRPPLRGASVGSTTLARGLRRIDLLRTGSLSDRPLLHGWGRRRNARRALHTAAPFRL
eukprot:1141705-Prorocentrum_minimum.AAC.1